MKARGFCLRPSRASDTIAVLQLVGPLFETVRQMRSDLDAVKEMISSKQTIGFRKDEPA